MHIYATIMNCPRISGEQKGHTRHDILEMLMIEVYSSLCGWRICVDLADYAECNERFCADSCAWSTVRPATTRSRDCYG